MEYSKPLKIKGKVISVNDIKQLSSIIDDEFTKSMNHYISKMEAYEKSFGTRSGKKDIAFLIKPPLVPPMRKYLLTGDDEMQYKSEDKGEIFSDQGPLVTSRIVAIEMNFEDRNENKGISIKLDHGSEDSETSNKIIVLGNDSTWTNGVYKKAEDMIKKLKKQTTITIPIRIGIMAAFSAIISLIFLQIILILIRIAEGGNVQDGWIIAFFFFMLFAISMAFSPPIVRMIEKLFPKVELVTGPEYLRPEAIGRKRLFRFIEVFGIPLVLWFLTLLIGAAIQ